MEIIKVKKEKKIVFSSSFPGQSNTVERLHRPRYVLQNSLLLWAEYRLKPGHSPPVFLLFLFNALYPL